MGVELAFERIEGARPERAPIAFLRGILGRGNNLKTIARRFVKARPDWEAWTITQSDRSDAYSPADRKRAAQIAASTDRLTMNVLPAGHWVHIDDPDGLLQTLFARIAADGGR